MKFHYLAFSSLLLKEASSSKASQHEMLRRGQNQGVDEARKLQVPLVDPFCLDFNSPDLNGFAPCPGYYDNIQVTPSTGQLSTNPLTPGLNDPADHTSLGDNYLHVKDTSGASVACAATGPLVGDWSNIACEENCYELCFDFNLLYDGCPTNGATSSTCNQVDPVSGKSYVPKPPTIGLLGAAPNNYYRAIIRGDFDVTDAKGPNPGWHHVCVPLGGIAPDTGLPVPLPAHNAHWVLGSGCNFAGGTNCSPAVPVPNPPDAALFCDIMSDITAINVYVDFTVNPTERVGIDNICIHQIEGCEGAGGCDPDDEDCCVEDSDCGDCGCLYANPEDSTGICKPDPCVHGYWDNERGECACFGSRYFEPFNEKCWDGFCPGTETYCEGLGDIKVCDLPKKPKDGALVDGFGLCCLCPGEESPEGTVTDTTEPGDCLDCTYGSGPCKIDNGSWSQCYPAQDGKCPHHLANLCFPY